MTVYDKTGLAVYNKIDNAVAGNNYYHLNLTNLISGMYYLEVNNNGVKSREKFIVSK